MADSTLRKKWHSDRDIHSLYIKALLERALREPEVADQLPVDENVIEPIARLAYYLDLHQPIIMIRSHQPFAEYAAPQLISDARPHVIPQVKYAAPSSQGDSLDIPEFEAGDLLVLPFHEKLDISHLTRLIHALSVTDNPVIIGCRHVSQVPEPLRAMVDLEIELPRPDKAIVTEVFSNIFGTMPDQEPEALERWMELVLPTDLQPAFRLEYGPEEALEYIRARIDSRLNAMLPESGPSLDDLKGLGEAKAIAVDLMADIKMAMAGKLDWSAVDRGMLLVGPPGTGKTALGRALARECGLKFVSASAPKWQAVDNLGSHLAKIRSTFDEARRYQPSILFIDEIDSIGNRQNFNDRNRSYSTGVVNCLLEELDGFGERDKVLIIAATNHEAAVDPALRRSGRLDNVVRVPYPNIPALGQIYRFYVEQLRKSGIEIGAIDYASIAGMSFGLTGADVEFFVKGAARRARRARRELQQVDIVAEVMRKPRSEEAAQRPIEPATLKRLACHEAGHAVIRLTSKHAGEDIGYVSIAPRNDGRIGYLATIKSDRKSLIVEDFHLEIKVLLAGRAAEELLFGADNLSDLSGRYGESSDLAMATRLTTRMTGLSGLSDQDDLVWWQAIPESSRDNLDKQIEATLARLYAETCQQLQEHSELLKRISARLESEQELSGEDLRAELQ